MCQRLHLTEAEEAQLWWECAARSKAASIGPARETEQKRKFILHLRWLQATHNQRRADTGRVATNGQGTQDSERPGSAESSQPGARSPVRRGQVLSAKVSI